MKRFGNWMQTYGGDMFYPLDPRPDEVSIEAIAHSLSLQCRFAGHTPYHYSVAQHCLIVAALLPDYMQYEGLLHDAAEAYLVDVPRPVKSFLTEYKGFEVKLEQVIAERFELTYPWPDAVKNMDELVLAMERKMLMWTSKNVWTTDHLLQTQEINRLHEVKHMFIETHPSQIKAQFLEKYALYKR